MPSASRLVEPGRVEVAGQRARAEEESPCSAGLPPRRSHTTSKPNGRRRCRRGAARARRPSARRCRGGRRTCRRCARCRSAMPVSRRCALRIAAVVDADDVADRVDRDLVEAASSRIQCASCCGAGAVRVGEVGDRQLAALGVARVAVAASSFGPVPDLVAEHRRDAELVVRGGSRRCGGCCAGTRRARSRGGCPAARSKVAMISCLAQARCRAARAPRGRTGSRTSRCSRR